MESKEKNNSRRLFLKQSSWGLGAALIGPTMISSACARREEGLSELEKNTKAERQLGVALVGLGTYATEQLAPALMETEYCKLAGVVTGTPESGERFQKMYKFSKGNIYNYKNFDFISVNPDIDIVYLVLPPALQADFAVRAFNAGKHVICEKPMALNVDDCQRILDARNSAGRMLSMGYRLHFDPYHQEIMKLGKEKTYGKVNEMENEFAMFLKDASNWRARAELGGGSVRDMGIYTIQAACYANGEDPIAVTATEIPKQRPDIFKDVEETMHFALEFPNGAVANCKCSLWDDYDRLHANAENGWFELEPSYYYSGQRGETSDRVIHHPRVNQQALQMDDFALRILNSSPTPVPGEMGARDVKIIEAIYESARTGERVEIYPIVTGIINKARIESQEN